MYFTNKVFLRKCTPRNLGFPGGSVIRIHLPRQETRETRVLSLDQEDPLDEETETHFSIIAWEIPWTEEPGGLQGMGVTESRDLTTEHTSISNLFHSR